MGLKDWLKRAMNIMQGGPERARAKSAAAAKARAETLRMAKMFEAVASPTERARHKLGRSLHTRGLTPRTRQARIASLTHAERRAALSAGWIR